jgi:hypothetical protein
MRFGVRESNWHITYGVSKRYGLYVMTLRKHLSKKKVACAWSLFQTRIKTVELEIMIY